MAGEFAAENEALRDEIGRPQVDLEGTQAELEAGRKAAEEECVQLSNALVELERLKHDDSAAARMVSRYMYVYTFPALLSSLPRPPTGNSPKPQPILYKAPSSPSKRATPQRHPHYTCSSCPRKPHLPLNGGSLRACAMCWTRRPSSSHRRRTAVGGRSHCSWPLSCGKTSWQKRSGGGCAARKRRARGRTCRLDLRSAPRSRPRCPEPHLGEELLRQRGRAARLRLVSFPGRRFQVSVVKSTQIASAACASNAAA